MSAQVLANVSVQCTAVRNIMAVNQNSRVVVAKVLQNLIAN